MYSTYNSKYLVYIRFLPLHCFASASGCLLLQKHIVSTEVAGACSVASFRGILTISDQLCRQIKRLPDQEA